MVKPIVPEATKPPIFPYSLDGTVAEYRYLCRRAARKFWRAGLERSDLEQVAAIGLIKAARRFDGASRTPFEAYAWIVIVGELMHYVRDFERPVRVPRRLQALESRFLRASDVLVGQLEREPNDGELALAMGTLTATVVELRGARQASLPLAIDEADTAVMRAPELSLEDRYLMQSAFAALSEIERRVIAGVYVLGLTQLELSRRLGISAKRVARVHREALGSMQRAWAS